MNAVEYAAMPWRLAPRAALSLGLLGAVGLTASAALLRLPASPPDPVEPPLQTLGCARVGSDAWSPLPGVEYTGSVLVDLPPALPAAPRGTMTLIVGDAIALDIEARSASGSFPFRRERMTTGPGVGVPPDLWLEAGTPFDMPRELTRLSLAAQERPVTVEIALGRRAPRVLARLSGYEAALKTRICAATRLAAASIDADVYELDLADSRHFATGWYAEERRNDGAPIRWMRRHGAIFVPSARGDPALITVRASPPSTGAVNDAPLLALTVNDSYDALTLPMSPGSHDYVWTIPGEAWVAGVNELLFSVSRTPRIEDTGGVTRGLALEKLSVTTIAY